MSEFSLLHRHLNKTVPVSLPEAERMYTLAKIKSLAPQEFLFKEGELARYVGFVNKGCLKYYQISNEGEENIIYFAIEEWWIGDLNSFYSNLPTQYFLQALEKTELFLYDKLVFDSIRSEIPAFDQYCKIRHAKATDARLENLVSQKSDTAEIRYQKLLEKIPDIFQRVPQRLIASYLGIKPQSLSRIRGLMAKKK